MLPEMDTTKLSPPLVTVFPLTSLAVMVNETGVDWETGLSIPAPEATEFDPDVGSTDVKLVRLGRMRGGIKQTNK